MLKSKSFAKKDRKGNVVTVVREHYLRDDIWCCVRGCRTCQHVDPILANPPSMKSSIIPMNHFVLPDTNVLYHQIDLMEHPAFKDMIIAQTVLQELRHRSMPVYNRIRALMNDPSRRIYLFSNEHHRETYVEREKDESDNDRNDRAIRRATAWYISHIQPIPSTGGRLTVVLLTDDVASRTKAVNEGLSAFSVSEYVESLKEFPELVDMVAGSGDDSAGRDRVVFDEHLSALQISAGLKDGSLIQGVLRSSPHNNVEATIFAVVDGKETSVVLSGRKMLNRAFDGDVVAVGLLPRTKWKSSLSEVAIEDDDETLLEENVETAMDIDKPALISTEDATPTGKVVGIIKRNWRPYCGSVDPATVNQLASTSAAQSLLLHPMDRRIPRIRFRTRQASALVGKRIVVAVDTWNKESRYPSGHFVKVLGDVGDRSTETDMVLLEHEVPFAPFTQQVLKCLPPEGESYQIAESEILKRRDFRPLDICSIDPPGCTDIDDALHCQTLPNGNYSVGVHIADVSHFVKEGNAMDAEAAVRGTTVYLVDKRIDMLPALLGTNLCSLRSNVDRLAFSCIWEMTSEAEIVNVEFTKSVIRSKASLTYEEAQARVDDSRQNDSITVGIRNLNKLAKILRRRRVDGGALTLASPEVRFRLERDTNDPVDVEMKELKETNALVEEFMLLANISVAKKIFQHFPDSAMLRRHPAPPSSNFDSLKKAISESFGLSLDTSSSLSLAQSLDKAVVPGDSYLNTLLRILTTRCMMQAVYFCSGTMAEPEFWHYGLAAPIYTHFTSPIRRYADVIVHRELAAAVGQGGTTSTSTISQGLTDKSKMRDLCENLNHRHRMAQLAGRASVELYTQLYFKGKVFVEHAYVTRILKNGFIALVPSYGIEGIVYTSDLKSNAAILRYDEQANTLSAPEHGVVLRLFSQVKVQITVEERGVAGLRSKLTLRMVEPKVPGMAPEVDGGAVVNNSNKHSKAGTAEGGSEGRGVKRKTR
ncbi:Dis3 protein [Gonapodya prolifera JEL478]|uniref:Ribosomal RNA-processing protein 44 n=1 Tax=Gonapodya prolifera (strain JEL478) TaxID=1344416 RepID=A0A139AX56_GONPJ|nr:Dis3 protein [Gonapodya prolifera JEL478]|eukprot:KXS21332.1 Dis3 protein [Gonapodya prolifera JEL478]